MRSLFAKILVWFLATVLITTVGLLAITALTIEPGERNTPFSKLITFQVEEARKAYETGGRSALDSYLQRLRQVFQGQAIFADASGRDLITGENRSDLIRRTPPRRLPFRLVHGPRVVISRASADGKYWLFLVIPHERVQWWFLSPEHLWVVGAVLVLCYALAYYLTSPLRRLQKALERFGQGDFSARAGTTRHDQLGELGRTFDKMAGRIQTLLSAERRLLLDISHELRSPLARLGVAIELARSGPDREGALDRIEKESSRLNTLVGELLQVTRAEGDPQSLRASTVRLDQVLRQVVDDGRIEATARGCLLEVVEDGPVTVRGDAELLRRAIENIIRNAIRYTPPASAVEIHLCASGGKAELRVRDYGPGVPEESLTRIFDAFYRVDDARNRQTGGVGLGLAIARRAVELHNGTLTARNAAPGLVVELELPLAREGADSAAPGVTQALAGAGPKGSSPERD
jgi:signal transduction histidine kinase